MDEIEGSGIWREEEENKECLKFFCRKYKSFDFFRNVGSRVIYCLRWVKMVRGKGEGKRFEIVFVEI